MYSTVWFQRYNKNPEWIVHKPYITRYNIALVMRYIIHKINIATSSTRPSAAVSMVTQDNPTLAPFPSLPFPLLLASPPPPAGYSTPRCTCVHYERLRLRVIHASPCVSRFGGVAIMP